MPSTPGTGAGGEGIECKADIADEMSEAAGIPDLPWASREGLGVARDGLNAACQKSKTICIGNNL